MNGAYYFPIKKHPLTMYKPIDIANRFLSEIDREAGDSITHLKLQKLLYYAQAWSLTLWNTPLFKENFQAWTHGPVLKSIFQEFKSAGYDVLPAPTADLPDFDEQADYVLKEVNRIYGEMSAKSLEELTHREDPWRIARGDLPLEAACTKVITKDSMKTFYSELLRKVNEQGR